MATDLRKRIASPFFLLMMGGDFDTTVQQSDNAVFNNGSTPGDSNNMVFNNGPTPDDSNNMVWNDGINP